MAYLTAQVHVDEDDIADLLRDNETLTANVFRKFADDEDFCAHVAATLGGLDKSEIIMALQDVLEAAR